MRRILSARASARVRFLVGFVIGLVLASWVIVAAGWAR